MLQSWIKFFQDGGFFMWPIAIMCVLGYVAMAERMYAILFMYNSNGAELMARVRRCIMDNNIDEAIKTCNARKHGLLERIFKSALVHADRPFDEIEDHVQVSILAGTSRLQHRMPYLFTIANVATLLGLLGTIVGLIATFTAVGAVEASQKQVLLSQGISTALNTTAFGLIAAIPCMLVYGFLLNRINHLADQSQHYTGELLILLRTGKAYFDEFDQSADLTTNQTPVKKKEGKTDAA